MDWIIVVTYLLGCGLMASLELLSGLALPELTEVEPEAADELAWMTGHLSWPWLLVTIASVAVIAIALLYRRKYPLAGLFAVALILFLQQGLIAFPNSVALVFLLYAVPVYRSVRAGWIGFAVVTVLDSAVMISARTSEPFVFGPAALSAVDTMDLREAITISVLNALWLLAVLMIGINLGNRRRYVQALIDRAHQLVREREQRAQLAAAAERSRIAREMHDIVAHSLSVVVTLSEAASVAVESQPAAASDAMQRAAETGRSALVEMRRLLGVLNDGQGSSPGVGTTNAETHAPRAPQPGISQVQELIDGLRQAGLRVEFTEDGVAGGDATQQLAVFRIVQEGLTNALRYAGRGAVARLTLLHTTAATTIEIIDSGSVSAANDRDRDGAAPGAGGAIPGSGRGLDGARERARMFGGSLEAGPMGAGWRLTASIPNGPVATSDTPMEEDE